MFMKIMQLVLERNKEAYFMKLVQAGAKLPRDFDTSTLIENEEKQKEIPSKKSLLRSRCPFLYDDVPSISSSSSQK